jgi:hypothetical protein
MLAGQSPSASEAAARALEKAASQAGQLAAGQPDSLPPSVANAMREAANALTNSAASANANNAPAAQASTNQARSALAQAAAALAMIRAGFNGSNTFAQAVPRSQGQAMQGQAQNPSQNQDPKAQGEADEQDPHRSTGNRLGTRSNVQNTGQRGNVTGSSQFLALPARDRAALTQSQNDKYPEQYGPQVEQYLRNLAEQDER